VLFHLFTQQNPVTQVTQRKMGPFDFANYVAHGNRLELPMSAMSHVIFKLIAACQDQEPSKRPDCGEIIKQLEGFLATLPIEPESPLRGSTGRGPPPRIGSGFRSTEADRSAGRLYTSDPGRKSPNNSEYDGTHPNISVRNSTNTYQQILTTSPIRSQPNNSSTNLYSPPTSTMPTSTTPTHSRENANSPVMIQVDPNLKVREPKDPAAVGWRGDISRETAEHLLRSTPDGTYLTRWSSTTSSYVLTYSVNGGRECKHIAGILPADEGEGVSVVRVYSIVLCFKNLADYIQSMKQAKVIIAAFPCIPTRQDRATNINYGALPM